MISDTADRASHTAVVHSADVFLLNLFLGHFYKWTCALTRAVSIRDCIFRALSFANTEEEKARFHISL